jgi:hypothetical protein
VRGLPSTPNWQRAEDYAGLLRAGSEAFAWEWLRRDPSYRAAAMSAQPAGASRPGVLTADPGAVAWGLHAFEDPAIPSGRARPVWTQAWFRGVLSAEARDAGPVNERFDLARFAALSTVARATSGAEHLLLSDGVSHLRLDIASGSLLSGPVCLSYRVSGLEALRGPLETLKGLVRLWQSGQLPRPVPSARNRRLILLLRACDGLRLGASQRELAVVLLSGDAASRRWRIETPSLRTRAQRLAWGARAMAGGGYRRLLGW